MSTEKKFLKIKSNVWGFRRPLAKGELIEITPDMKPHDVQFLIGCGSAEIVTRYVVQEVATANNDPAPVVNDPVPPESEPAKRGRKRKNESV